MDHGVLGVGQFSQVLIIAPRHRRMAHCNSDISYLHNVWKITPYNMMQRVCVCIYVYILCVYIHFFIYSILFVYVSII